MAGPRSEAVTARQAAAFAVISGFFFFCAAQTFHSALRLYIHAKQGQLSGERPWLHEDGGVAPLANAIDSVIAMNGDDAAWMVKQGFRRIALSESDERWMAEDQILGLIRRKVHFMDVTDQDLESLASRKARTGSDLPKEVSHQSTVELLASNVSIPSLTSWLTELSSSFKTRYYQSTSGAKASEWIFGKVQRVSKKAGGGIKVSVTQFDHPWPQSSVIARIEGKDPDAPIVVISAHLDSVNQWNPWFGQSPGADDDGFVPKRTIEFHWYAGEEGGLLGSQKVVASYKESDVPVFGVFHSDMTGYLAPDKPETIAIVTDFVDAKLTDFLKVLIEAYSDVKWTQTKCGYTCSDHATWTKAGYPAVFTFETEFDDHSPFIHTTDDDVSHVSFEHVARFSKLALAFAVEMSLY
ncbi:hypothetical protein DFJ73DRAFT_824837 [Zopfochytrium polystomum]|nr:hypothetical protein DFJ73DRAFT_824837 [Zopfochytrium polystomum]